VAYSFGDVPANLLTTVILAQARIHAASAHEPLPNLAAPPPRGPEAKRERRLAWMLTCVSMTTGGYSFGDVPANLLTTVILAQARIHASIRA
jgi:hypothetical protein